MSVKINAICQTSFRFPTAIPSTARPHGGSGASFGVAGFHARKSQRASAPAPLAIGNIGTGNISTLATFSTPIGHWQHFHHVQKQ